MAEYNFADQYKLAGLNPSAEQISLRHTAIQKISKSLDFKKTLDLVRLYFGLPINNETNWFRDSFLETDASFSMVGNEREISVLAYCLLNTAMADNKTYAGLATLTSYAYGNRSPKIFPDLIDNANKFLKENSINSKQHIDSKIDSIKHAPKSKVPPLVEALLLAPDWPKTGEAIKQTSNEAMEAHKNLTNQVFSVFSNVVKQNDLLREEVDMLWWFIGGWSSILETPFNDLDLGIAALMSGIELADLSEESCGPVAAPAILRRLLFSANRQFTTEKLSLNSIVNSIPKDTFELLTHSQTDFSSLFDICPVMTAICKASEVGQGEAWHAIFKKMTGLEATIEFEPLQFAMQVYRESLLLKDID